MKKIGEEKYLTCKYDRVFKDVFLDAKDTSLLKELLESILKVKIYTIEIQNTELTEGNAYLRRKNLDALLETNEGIINIEVNSSLENWTRVRNYAFLSRVYANHTLRSEDYDVNQQFIQINFTYGLTDKEFYRIYYLQDREQKKFIPNVKIYEFNVDKYVKLWYTKENILENKCIIMMNLPKKELELFSKEDKVVKEYMYKLNRINEDPAYLNLIDYEEDNIRIMNAERKQAKKEGRELGLKEGIEEGRKEGIEEGRKEGIEEGVLIVAKNLLNTNMKIEEISNLTGISKEQLIKLKKSS